MKNEVFYITIFILCIIVMIVIYHNKKQMDSKKEGFTPCDITVENLLDPTNGLSVSIPSLAGGGGGDGVSCTIT